MKIIFVVLLLVFMGLMYTVQAEDLTEGQRDPPPPPLPMRWQDVGRTLQMHHLPSFEGATRLYNPTPRSQVDLKNVWRR
ncbi:hypothetical protein CHS0354_014023 [Potamilus streckersoni]|uniref:Uncharacterized protein n=1 Tax=Potamilus streckersoni TaxID=2493646 RepID=A0AAE0TM66_9BIVA|nr:hypothetical protein CHS0354_014023 [Potamilus streckersoni]